MPYGRGKKIMKLANLKIDQKKSGFTQFLLTDVKPWYEYADGKRTDKQLGYSCEVALPKQQLDKITVHVAKLDLKIEPKMQRVDFHNLDISLYPDFRNPSEVGVKATADDVREVG